MQTPIEQYRWLEAELASLIGPIKFSAEINLRLERMSQLLALLGNPQESYRSVHVGGTSGKGSTATLIAAVLQGHGLKVGLHTSPHLQVLNERHQINGHMAPTSRLVEVWQTMRSAIVEVKATSPFGAPSYFEAQVALSFCLFATEEVDVAVVEVGLGGTLDATNVLQADVAVLTNVGLDHTEILGDTVVKIAQDKVGIIKRNQKVVTGASQPEVQEVIAARCRARGARLWQLGRDFLISQGEHPRPEASLVTFHLPGKVYADVELGLSGSFQVVNGAVALAAVHSLLKKVDEAAVRQALRETRIPGRVEIIQEAPLVILDGAHNPDKVRGSAEIVRADWSGKRIITVLGLKAGKAATDILGQVVPLSDQMIMTQFVEKGLWQAVPPEKLVTLAHAINPNLPCEAVADPLEAIRLALDRARPEDLIWVTGSLYLVGDIRGHWISIETLIP